MRSCNPGKAYSQLLLNKVPGQYETRDENIYKRIQAVIDYISGMTDIRICAGFISKNKRNEPLPAL